MPPLHSVSREHNSDLRTMATNTDTDNLVDRFLRVQGDGVTAKLLVGAAGTVAVVAASAYRGIAMNNRIWKPIQDVLVNALHKFLEKARELTPDKTKWDNDLANRWNDVVDAATETLDQHSGSILNRLRVTVFNLWIGGFKKLANFCVGLLTKLVKEAAGAAYADLTLHFFTVAYAGVVTGDLAEKVVKEYGEKEDTKLDTRAQAAGFLGAMVAGAAAGGLATGGIGAFPGAVIGGASYGIKKLFFS